MQLEEGQVYEGTISISGDEGPFRRWIVVAPFGKTHIHCVDDPLDLHCWPAPLIEFGIESGRLQYVGATPDHPAIRVQRLKETLGVRDAHMSVSEASLERLLGALRTAVAANEDYAPYLAGEILAAAARSPLLSGRREGIVASVHTALGDHALALPQIAQVSSGVSEIASPMT